MLPPEPGDGPVFDEVWQAQVLAMADIFIREGRFAAGAWAETLGAELSRAEAAGEPDTNQTYYSAALNALEALLAVHGGPDKAALAARKSDWERAYLATPHGEPVELSRGQEASAENS